MIVIYFNVGRFQRGSIIEILNRYDHGCCVKTIRLNIHTISDFTAIYDSEYEKLLHLKTILNLNHFEKIYNSVKEIRLE